MLQGREKLSPGSQRAQLALASQERPNGKANTVITKAPLQGAVCSESVPPEKARVFVPATLTRKLLVIRKLDNLIADLGLFLL